MEEKVQHEKMIMLFTGPTKQYIPDKHLNYQNIAKDHQSPDKDQLVQLGDNTQKIYLKLCRLVTVIEP